MRNYDFVLALDPSGSFHEGKGTTGWCILECAADKIIRGSSLKARNYQAMEAYWESHLALIKEAQQRYGKRFIVVIEDYLLYANQSSAQINSRMETCKLIGALQLFCYQHHIPYCMQIAAEVKNRWTDEILHYKKYLGYRKSKHILPNGELIDHHCRDSIRHAVHYHTFKNKKEVS